MGIKPVQSDKSKWGSVLETNKIYARATLLTWIIFTHILKIFLNIHISFQQT
jgi:hypothetical protein